MSDANKESKIKKIFTKVDIEDTYNKLESNVPALAVTVICAIVLMAFICCAVFFARVKGPEKVLVPEVTGMQLEDALLVLQTKQLFPSIILRPSDTVEKGVVMDQDPKAQALKKGRSDITLYVSRGQVLENIENYVGKDIDSVADASDDSKKKSAIVFNNPIYKYSDKKEGTILAQNLKEGTPVYSKTNVQLVVSKGASKKSVTVPALFEKPVDEFYKAIKNTNIIYDVTSHLAGPDETIGTVSTKDTGKTVQEFERVSVDFAFPAGNIDDTFYGIFEDTVIDYPVPVKMKLESISNDGEHQVLTEFYHKGGTVTIPYSLKRGTTVYFYINGIAQKKFVIE
ncbi:MAG: PASTA domain-containing protein [Treponema sp.]|nr:PASTA domain-containing protein [Treponema sp.]